MAYLMFKRKGGHQLAALLWAFVFGALMFVSGARSAIFGAVAAFIYSRGHFRLLRRSRGGSSAATC